MKLITLNIWGGQAGKEKLLNFLASHNTVDVFCFQEVWCGNEDMVGQIAGGVTLQAHPYILKDIEKALPEYRLFFRPHFRGAYGLALFVKKDLFLEKEGEISIYKEAGYESPTDLGDHGRNLQYITLNTPHKKRTLAHIHGIWNGKGKADSDDRIEQSERIIRFLKTLDHPYVLAGDFNLRPDTKSIKLLEDFGLRNLVKEFKVTSTQTSLYTKSNELFADYIFTHPDIRILDFQVLPDEVSDHAALYIEFE